MSTLLIFPTPPDAVCLLKTDRGDVLPGHPATHHTGRQGIAFDIPDGVPTGNGAFLDLSAPGYAPLHQRGVLWLKSGTPSYPWDTGQTAAFAADDFMLPKAGALMPALRTAGTAFVVGP